MDYSNFNVLYYNSKEIRLDNIIWGLLQLGAEVERSELNVTLNKPVEEEIEYIRREIVRYNCVFSQNFSVNIAIACYHEAVPYISWVYDSPQVSLYTEHALYPTNFIFAFDKKQVERLKACGIENIFHMPLAANMAYVSGISVTDADRAKYGTDISFVGQLYRTGYMSNFVSKAPQEVLYVLEKITEEKALKWGREFSIYESLPAETVEKIGLQMSAKEFEYFNLIDKQFIQETMLLGPMIAKREREEVLRKASEQYKTTLYTRESDYEYAKETLENVRVRGPVRDQEPYKVYASSKLNLNLTLRTIETAVPQRIFDIMSMGGVVISNYQEEAEELFVPDKEIILFHSLDEFYDKAKFYLNHSSLRKKIGEAGYRIVRDRFNYVKAIDSMIDTVIKTIG